MTENEKLHLLEKRVTDDEKLHLLEKYITNEAAKKAQQFRVEQTGKWSENCKITINDRSCKVSD